MIIGGTLQLTDRHTITAWLNLINNNGVLTATDEFAMPKFDTLYYINIETINYLIAKLNSKLYPPHTLLLDFKRTKDSFLSEENHSCPENQKENMGNNQQNKSLLSNLTQKEN